MSPTLYLIGSLRNPSIPKIGNQLRAETTWDIFDDWYAAGPHADDCWRDYEIGRGHNFSQALVGYAAKHTFQFDLHHLNRASAGVLVLPAGKSGHLELGYLIGQGKPGYILLDKQPERFDVMYQFATGVFDSLDALVSQLNKDTYLEEAVSRSFAHRHAGVERGCLSPTCQRGAGGLCAR